MSVSLSEQFGETLSQFDPGCKDIGVHLLLHISLNECSLVDEMIKFPIEFAIRGKCPV